MKNLNEKEREFLKKTVSQAWWYKVNNTLNDQELQTLYRKIAGKNE